MTKYNIKTLMVGYAFLLILIFDMNSGNSAAGQDGSQKMESMLTKALSEPITIIERFELGGLLPEYPDKALKILDKEMEGLQIKKDSLSDYFMARYFLRLIGAVANESALNRLDAAYKRWKGKEFYPIRQEIIISLYTNSRGLKTIKDTVPDKTAQKLKNWLKDEDEPEVLGVGLRILSSITSDLSAELLENVKGKISDFEIDIAVRKVKINGLNTYPEVYQNTTAWIDELIKDIEGEAVFSWKNQESRESLIYFSFKKLRNDPRELKKHLKEFKARVQKCQLILKSLEDKIKRSKPDEDRLNLHRQGSIIELILWGYSQHLSEEKKSSGDQADIKAEEKPDEWWFQNGEE